MKIGIVIQARMNSSRLPKKVLKLIGDKNLLEHILFRLSKLETKSKIILATSTLSIDDDIKEFANLNNIECFRGSEQNVLQRYFSCAKKYGFDHIVRLTGDNPFLDIEELDNLISLHIDSNADYSNSFSFLPKGVGLEIFTFAALEKSYFNGKEKNHKEHVNEYIEENKELFKISYLNVAKEKNRPDISLTVDTFEDYKKACYIFNNTNKEFITTQEAIKLCLQYV